MQKSPQAKSDSKPLDAEENESARLNKNFVHQWPVPYGNAYTPLMHDLIIVLLRDAQKIDRRIVDYESAYALLRRLGRGDSGQDYASLERALDELSQLRYKITSAYIPPTKKLWLDDPKYAEEVREQAEANGLGIRAFKAREKAKKPKRQKWAGRFLTKVEYRTNGRVKIKLSDEFFTLNRTPGYHVPAYLKDCQQLRSVLEKRLLLKLRCSRAGTRIKQRIVDWERLGGISDSNYRRFRTNLRTAAKSVEKVRGGPVTVTCYKSGMIVLCAGSTSNKTSRHRKRLP